MRRLRRWAEELSVLKEDTIALEPYDTLIIFSDGATEEMNTEPGLFGQSRLEALIPQCRNAPASAIVYRIVAAMKQYDDITVIAVKRPAV